MPMFVRSDRIHRAARARFRLHALAAGLGMMTVAGTTLADAVADTDAVDIPLERHADRNLNFEGASVMPAGTWRGWIGGLALDPRIDVPGTGNQIYYFGIERAFSPRWQLGFSVSFFDDLPPRPIQGILPQIVTETAALHAKVQLLDSEYLQVAGLLSAEAHHFSSRPDNSESFSHKIHMIGAAALPVSVPLFSGLELQLLPSYSVLPETVSGQPYYGDVASFGGGLSWRLGRRVELYGSYNEPLSGANTIASDGSLERKGIYSAGARLNVTPRVAVDVGTTNGMGVTPATRILAFFPDGTNDMYSVKVTWTPPTAGNPIPATYSRTPHEQEPDDIADDSGFTLSSATTLGRGRSFGTYWSETDGESMGGRLVYSPEQHAQITASLEGFSNDGSVDFQPIQDTTDRWSVGLRLGLLDQLEGAPFSSAVAVSMGRTVSSTARVGTLYVALPQTWRAHPRVQFNFSPMMSQSREFDRYGFGFGVTGRLVGDLLGVAEVTPVLDGERTVWAAGLRLRVLRSVQLQALATNAVGLDGLGTLTAQESTRYVAGFRVDLPSWTLFP